MHRCIAFMVACALAACSGEAPRDIRSVHQAQVVDAVHGSGREGFYFLPPLVAATALPPSFDASLTLTARLDGPGGVTLAAVPLLVTDGHYQGSIDTDGLALDPAVLYRLRVSSASRELGSADVQIYTSERAARSAASDELFELVDGKKLLVKAYANQCASCGETEGCCAGVCTPLDSESSCGACGVACTAPESCGGGGTPGACGCTPRTCEDVFSCGQVDDGCGGVLDCCPGAQACPCAQTMNGFNFPANQFPTCCTLATGCVSTPDVCEWTPPPATCGPASTVCQADPTHQLFCCAIGKGLFARLCTGPGNCLHGGTYPNCLEEAECPEGSVTVPTAVINGVQTFGCRNNCGNVGPGGCAGCNSTAFTSSCSVSWDGSACRAVKDGVSYCTTLTTTETGCPFSEPRFCKWTTAPCDP